MTVVEADLQSPCERRACDGLPRLLELYRPDATVELREHLRRYGPPPWRGSARRGRAPLLHTIEQAGLRGRGGAGFATARKMRAVAATRGPSVVIANGAEG